MKRQQTGLGYFSVLAGANYHSSFNPCQRWAYRAARLAIVTCGPLIIGPLIRDHIIGPLMGNHIIGPLVGNTLLESHYLLFNG